MSLDRINDVNNNKLTDTFIDAFNEIALSVHENAKSKGFYENPTEVGTRIALMHSELSEALEADRNPSLPSKLSGRSLLEEELADVVIRIMDFAAWECLDVGAAIIQKARYNKNREYMHGNKSY